MATNEERKFLHDLATPLGTAILLADMILQNSKKKPQVSAEEIEQMEMIANALDKIQIKLKERRQHLINQSAVQE
jgi:hypothetical protein